MESIRKENSNQKIKLFCIPNAGGSAMMYRCWENSLSNQVELIPVELAGRGRRFKTPLYEELSEAVDDVYNSISEELNGGPYAIFGHSMGGTVAYELCRKIAANNIQQPVHAFISGRCPDGFEKDKRIMHQLPDKELLDEIVSYGGIDDEILQDEEMVSFMLQIVRADYKILETYHEEKDSFQFQYNISAVCGNSDSLADYDGLCEWKKYAAKECDIKIFEGSHFYLNEHPEEVTDYIYRMLSRYI